MATTHAATIATTAARIGWTATPAASFHVECSCGVTPGRAHSTATAAAGFAGVDLPARCAKSLPRDVGTIPVRLGPSGTRRH